MAEANINQLNECQIDMYLLYAQSLEIQKLYYQTIKENSLNYLKYYLLPKKWLDNLKSKYNYSYIKQQINALDCRDYNTFKQNLLKNKTNSNNNNDNFINEFKSIEANLETKCISIYQFNYPCNFVLVREDIFEKMNINKKLLYEIIIGENNIFIIDNKNIYICTLSFDKNNEDISEFVINIEGFIILNEKKKIKERKRLFKYISNNKGIKNYYKERNINTSIKEKQMMIDKEGEEVGMFFSIEQKQEYITPGNFLEEYINQMYPNEIIQNENELSLSQMSAPQNKETELENQKEKITEVGLKLIFGSQNKINKGKKKAPKCISIKGDIYYYKTHSNYSVCEFNPMPKSNYYNNNNFY